jgi:hypothetical protein
VAPFVVHKSAIEQLFTVRALSDKSTSEKNEMMKLIDEGNELLLKLNEYVGLMNKVNDIYLCSYEVKSK